MVEGNILLFSVVESDVFVYVSILMYFNVFSVFV